MSKLSEQMVTLHVWIISMLTAKKVKENQEEWSSTCLESPSIKKICYHWAKRLQYNTKHAWYSKVCITRRINWPCSKLFTISTLVNTCEYLQILGWSKSTSISVSTWLFTGTWPVSASTCIQVFPQIWVKPNKLADLWIQIQVDLQVHSCSALSYTK